MKSDLYGSADIEICQRKGHKFQTAWSDKTPLKVSLICRTCTERDHKTVYVAYGVPEKSWGAWRPRPREDKQPETNLDFLEMSS